MPILNTNELEVPSDKRSVTIYFSALDYGDNQHIRYAWMLEGSDGGWNYVGEEHSASFNRLPHGHLKLLVRSTNADGVWQNNTKELCIYAHPTFWESWMGWVLYFILGGGIIALAMYMFAQNQRIKLQTEMSEMRTSFFTSISPDQQRYSAVQARMLHLNTGLQGLECALTLRRLHMGSGENSMSMAMSTRKVKP